MMMMMIVIMMVVLMLIMMTIVVMIIIMVNQWKLCKREFYSLNYPTIGNPSSLKTNQVAIYKAR